MRRNPNAFFEGMFLRVLTGRGHPFLFFIRIIYNIKRNTRFTIISIPPFIDSIPTYLLYIGMWICCSRYHGSLFIEILAEALPKTIHDWFVVHRSEVKLKNPWTLNQSITNTFLCGSREFVFFCHYNRFKDTKNNSKYFT